MTIKAPALAVSLAVALSLLFLLVGRSGFDDARLQIRVRTADVESVRAALDRDGYDVIGVDAASATIDLVVSPAERRALERRGLTGVVIDYARPFGRSLGRGATLRAGFALPAAAPPATYSDLDGIVSRMHEIAMAYPEIAQVVDLTATYNTPATFEGRHLYALKISDNVAVDEDEPAVMVVSAHHAREVVTPVVALYAVDQLTRGYQSDPRIAAAVNGNEIWIAPVWNPDGYNHVFTTDNYWRKNRRIMSGGVGVDQNRNYPQGWSASCAGSTSPSSETYKGTSPASEPETQTMMAWSQAERFAKVVDFHSYGREVLYAYRCLSHPFRVWMQSEAAAIATAAGYGGLARLPSAEGEHQEWQFARMGSYAFLIETHSEFQPAYDSAVAEAAQVWPALLGVVERPISVSGHVTDATTGLPLAARVDLLDVAFANGETNGSGGQYGAYHMFLPAGAYAVRFSADGYAPAVHTVVVTPSSAATLDVQLSPAAEVFADDFETNRGWTTNPFASDTATTGRWERGDPQSTSSSGPKQLGTTPSGVNALVTGRLAGSSAGSHDVDGGRTSIQSPAITLPATGTLTLSFSYYLAHTSNSSSADYFRVRIVGLTTTTVLEELGAGDDDDAAWTVAQFDLSAFAGQTVRILFEAADAAGGSIVEAAVDDVKIVRQ